MAKKKATRSTKARAAGHKSLDSRQQDLPGVETNRVPQIERIVKKIVTKSSERSALKTEVDTLRDNLVPLFKKHEINQYSCHGKTVIVEPGGDVVKFKNAKATG